VRWLREDGALCRPGEVVAFCNIGLKRAAWPREQPLPFHEEMEDFQVAFATPIGGRLRHAPGSSQGGYADLLQESGVWTPDFAIGTIEPMSGQAPDEGEGQLRLLMATGRRATGLAEDRAGLLTGWHDRSRAWRTQGDGPIGTLLSLGICELLGVIKGDSLAFLEMFDEIAGPAQVVFVPDEALVPNARVVAEQIRRTPAQKAEMAEDLARTLAGGPITPGPADWIFAGAVLKALQSSPAGTACAAPDRPTPSCCP
jgi:hypothetical protein